MVKVGIEPASPSPEATSRPTGPRCFHSTIQISTLHYDVPFGGAEFLGGRRLRARGVPAVDVRDGGQLVLYGAALSGIIKRKGIFFCVIPISITLITISVYVQVLFYLGRFVGILGKCLFLQPLNNSWV